MKRRLEVARQVAVSGQQLRGPFTLHPPRWLPSPARPAGGGRWLVELHAAGLTREVICTVGAPWRRDGITWRRVRWEPVVAGDHATDDRFLPSLSGEIGLDETEGGVGRLSLSGTYAPPGGFLGGALDVIGLHAVATASAKHFLDAVAHRLVELAAPPAADDVPPSAEDEVVNVEDPTPASSAEQVESDYGRRSSRARRSAR